MVVYTHVDFLLNGRQKRNVGLVGLTVRKLQSGEESYVLNPWITGQKTSYFYGTVGRVAQSV